MIAGSARTLGLGTCLFLGTADLVYLNIRLAPAMIPPLRPAARNARVPIAAAIESAPAPAIAPPPTETETEIEIASESESEPAAIPFATGQAAVRGLFRGEIERQAAMAVAAEGMVVVVEGHADARGDELANLELSRRRAAAVARRLRAAGVPRERIMVRSFGSHRPAVDGADSAALQLNRRVEIIIERGPP